MLKSLNVATRKFWSIFHLLILWIDLSKITINKVYELHSCHLQLTVNYFSLPFQIHMVVRQVKLFYICHTVTTLLFDICPFFLLRNDEECDSYFRSRGYLKSRAYLKNMYSKNNNIKLPTCLMAVFRTKQMRCNLWPLSVIGGESFESIWDLSLSPVKSFPRNWPPPSWLLPNLRPALLHNSMLEYV